ncbi:MAG: DUF6314 family protein [Alphaproteobacteria bacterium]
MTTNGIDSIFAQWSGNWLYKREIRQAGQPAVIAVVEGEARYAPRGNSRYDYEEKGRVWVAASGKKYNCFRHFHIERHNDAIISSFADGIDAGKPFQTLDLDHGVLGGLPTDGANRRRSKYSILDADHFTATHETTGPRGNFITKTSFTRKPSGSLGLLHRHP